ncbi:hypothetical protein [Pseudothermotoga sp.]
MMRILLFLSLLFAVVITATQVVIYQFELVQLNQEFVTKFNLKEFEAKFPKDGSFFSFSYLPKEMELNIALPLVQMSFEVGERTTKSRSSTRPWLSTIVNEKAAITIASEELSLLTGVRTGKGLKFELTPTRILDRAVATKISISDPYGSTRFENELEISRDDFSLIGLVTLKRDDGFQHVALYAKASVASALPQENVYSSGSLDEMAKIFLEKVEREPSEVYGVLIYDGNFQGRVDLVLWTDAGIVLNASVAIPSMNFSAGLEKLVGGEGLRVGAKISYGQELCLALGFSDVSKLTNFLSLFASLYPIKISLQDATFKSPEWSFGMVLSFDEVTIRLGIFSESAMVFSSDVKFNFTKNFFASVGMAYDFASNKPCFRVGFGVNF